MKTNRRNIRCLHLGCGWRGSEVLLGWSFSQAHATESGHWSFAWQRVEV